MKTPHYLTKQKGAISVLGAMAIALGLGSFQQMLQYGNAKILDRELDNYALTVASVALRSELAITKAGIDAGTIPSNQTDIVINSLLSKVEMYTTASDDQAVNIKKQITFGKLNAAGNFEALSSNASNPRGATNPPDFSAVAVQLWSTDSFMGVYTPQGKAIYGLGQADQNADSGCYCKTRYTACLDKELTEAYLSPIPSGDAAAIAVKDSVARKNYCNYGYSEEKLSDSTSTKYPYIELNDAWIGRPPQTTSFFNFYSASYSGEKFDRVLNHQPVSVKDGEDPLKSTSGFSGMFGGFFCMFGCSSTDLKAKQQNGTSAFEKNDITPTSSQSDYVCEKPGFMFIPTTYPACNSASSSNDVVLHDGIYVGYKGTCVADTSSGNVGMSRCLSYNDGVTPRYESCLEIERRSAVSMNFFQRMMAFFFGPILDWERSYEGLDCEMKKMRYVGWMFWGGWQEV